MKAFLVDPSKEGDDFVTQIDIKDWTELAPTIGGACRFFTTVRLDETNTVYVDDEGLYNGALDIGIFGIDNYPQPLAGRGVVQGVDPETGDSVDSDMTLEEAKRIFENIPREEVAW